MLSFGSSFAVRSRWRRAFSLLAISCSLHLVTGCEGNELPSTKPANSSGSAPSSSGQVDNGSSGASGSSGAGGSSGASSSSGGSVEPGTVRVATYNTRLFFDTKCDSNNCDGNAFERVLTQSEYTSRVQRTAASIVRLEADVVLLQEIETEAILQDIQQELRNNGHDYSVAVHGEIGVPGSIDVAVLARGALNSVTKHRQNRLPLEGGGTTTFAREFLEVALTTESGQAMTVFAAHFLSKVNDNEPRRIAEGQGARNIVAAAAQRLPDSWVVFGGDLNDTPDSETLQRITDDGGLLRYAADKTAAEQATYRYNGQLEAIDHLFGVGASANAYVPKSATALRDGSGGFGDSDHAALRVELRAP